MSDYSAFSLLNFNEGIWSPAEQFHSRLIQFLSISLYLNTDRILNKKNRNEKNKLKKEKHFFSLY